MELFSYHLQGNESKQNSLCTKTGNRTECLHTSWGSAPLFYVENYEVFITYM